MMRALLWNLIEWIYPPAVCWRGYHAPISEERIILQNVSRRELIIAGFMERRLICYYCGHQFASWTNVAGPVALEPELSPGQIAAIERGEALIFEGSSNHGGS